MLRRMSRFVKPLARDSGPVSAGNPLERPDELRGLALAAARGDAGAAASLVIHVGSSMLIVVRKVLGRSADVHDDQHRATDGNHQRCRGPRVAARRRERQPAQLVGALQRISGWNRLGITRERFDEP